MTVIDGAVCSKAVTVFTKTYGKTVSIEPHAGIRIEPHPGLSLLYRKGGILARGQSDLAIIHLEDPITNIIEGPGIHAYGGDSGGPCLRWPEGATEPVLVGITRGGGAPIYSVFTSTTIANHREWIERVIREAESLPGEGSR